MKNELKYTRKFNVKLELHVSHDQIRKDFLNQMTLMLNKVNIALFDFFNKNQTKFHKKKNVKDIGEAICKPEKDGGYGFVDFYTKLGFPNYIKNEKTIMPEHQSTPKRGYLRSIAEKYFSFIKRNKKMCSRMCRISDKTYRLHNGQVSIDTQNKKIKIRPLGPAGQTFEYSIKLFRARQNLSNQKIENEILRQISLKKSFGGNLTLTKIGRKKNKKEYVLFNLIIEIEQDWKYEPKGFFGFDINQNKKDFIVFSKILNINNKTSSVVSKKDLDKRIIIDEKRLRTLNRLELIKDKDRKNSIRYKIKRCHKRLKKRYEFFAKQIADHAEENELCICIDNLKCGKKTGSFGQDKIIPILQDICLRRRIPFVIVPTPYTTRMCNACKYVHKSISLDIRKFNCKNCGVELIRDKNAAQNIEELGKMIWEQGIEKTKKIYKENYNIDIIKS